MIPLPWMASCHPSIRGVLSISQALSLLLLLTSLALLPQHGIAQEGSSQPISGTTQTITTYNPPPLGQTEGCFNTFDYAITVSFGDQPLDNAVCQALCADHAFSVSATAARSCMCGHAYPSIIHRVEDRHCAAPCSLDQDTCLGNECCGSAGGERETYYTVAFAGEADVRKTLLRRLMHDYRSKAPVYSSYVSSLMAETTTLQVLPATSGSSSSSSGANVGGPVGSLGLSGGCPITWKTVGSSCFKHSNIASSQNYDQSQSACQVEGGTLAVLADPLQQAAVASLVVDSHSSASWIGLSVKDSPLGPFWSWDYFVNWAGDQPDESTAAMASPPYGPDKGATFDEFSPDNVGISSIAIGYGPLGSIMSLKTSYRKGDGTVVEGQERGGAGSNSNMPIKTTDTISLALGEWITGAYGSASSEGVMSLTLITTDAMGRSTKHGPYGKRGQGDTAFNFTASGDVTAIYGRSDGAVIMQLGFYQYQGKRCTRMNDVGQLETIFCEQPYQQPFYLCERPHTTSLEACDDSWRDAGHACLKSFRSDGPMAWVEAKAACEALQGRLAQLDSPSKAAMGWAMMQQVGGFVGLRDHSPSSLYRIYGWDRYHNYAEGQPKLTSGIKTRAPTCVMMPAAAGGKWATVGCDVSVDKVRVVCETTPQDADCSCAAGWQAFECMCYQAAPTLGSSSWTHADAYCSSLEPGGRLPRVPNQRTNEKLRTLAGAGASTFLGLADMLGSGHVSEDTYVGWPGGKQPEPQSGSCATMRSDGRWYSTTCASGVSASLCSMPQAPSKTFLGKDGGQSFRLVELPDQELSWGTSFQVQIADAASGALLAVDESGAVVSVPAESATPSSTTFTINFLRTGPSSTGGPKSVNPTFTIMNQASERYLLYDPEVDRLITGVNPNPQYDAVGNGYATAFMSSRPLRSLALRRLQMSVASRASNNGTLLQYCTAFVYDLTPNMDSYACFDVQHGSGGTTPLPVVHMELAALATQDKTQALHPRVPLDYARKVCNNSNADQPASCSLTFAGPQIFTTSVAILHGYSIQEQFQMDSGSPGPSFLSSSFHNTYTDTTKITYASPTEAYTAVTSVPPLSTTALQFWQATVQSRYTWQARFTAKGSFHMSAMGVALGDMRALTTVSSAEDLDFYLWGLRSYPSLSQMVLTVDMAEHQTYPLERPPVADLEA